MRDIKTERYEAIKAAAKEKLLAISEIARQQGIDSEIFRRVCQGLSRDAEVRKVVTKLWPKIIKMYPFEVIHCSYCGKVVTNKSRKFFCSDDCFIRKAVVTRKERLEAYKKLKRG